MDISGREGSGNVEDRRGMRTIGAAAGGGGILVLVVFLAAQFLGLDPNQAKQLAEVVQKLAPTKGVVETQGGQPDPAQAKQAHFTSVVLKSTEDVWQQQFARYGKKYEEPVLVMFTDRVASGCGVADAGVGPFYCGADHKVYIDLSFYVDMETKLGAPGEFARAYVIAHEVGHHVQRLLGYSALAEEGRRSGRMPENQSSVRLELQADYLAGVWAHHARNDLKLNVQDIGTAINAANKIGDDYLQKNAGRRVNREAFTHGSSEQRMRWFKKGYDTGDLKGANQLFELNYNDL